MAATTNRKKTPVREPRVPRTYRLPLSKVKAAKRALGAATATDTIEQALDLVVFQRQHRRHTVDAGRSDLESRRRLVARASRKFVLDSHLFIHAFRDPPANLALQDFHILAVMARAEGLEVGRVSKAFANGGG